MSFTSSCPQCHQQVTVPDGAGADARVRCPLCDAEYPLGEVLALAPPALIVVGVAAEATAAEAVSVEPPVGPAEATPEAIEAKDAALAEFEAEEAASAGGRSRSRRGRGRPP